MALVYVEREFLPPQVRAFSDAVIAWLPRLESALSPGDFKAAAREAKKAK
jgi:hypothetical protein